MIYLYDHERRSSGWESIGSVDEARQVVARRMFEYDHLDCDNSWSTFILIAREDDFIEAWIGNFDHWLFNPNRGAANVYMCEPSHVKAETGYELPSLPSQKGFCHG